MTLPFQNDTSKIMKKLAKADLKAHRLKTVLSGTIILIATCLMAVVFMILFNDTMDQTNNATYHAMYRAVDDNTKNILINNSFFEKAGLYKYFGGIVEENGRTDISYMDSKAMKFLGYRLLNGNYPIDSNEILISAEYLKKHNLPVTIGGKLCFSYIDSLTNQKVQKQFIVSGTIENQNQEKANQFYIITSDAFRLQIAAQGDTMQTSNFSTQTPDSIDVLVQLNKEKSALGIDAQKEFLKNTGIDLGIKSYDIILNYMYIEGVVLEPTQIISVIFFALLIMFASSFVIYSIFYISIVNSIQTYAQMMSLGTTAKQLKYFLRTQGNILALRFVPMGILLSLFITVLASSTKWLMYDLVIAILSGLLIVVVIKLSLKKPMKTLASISPIEAMKYSGSPILKKQRCLKHITPTTLAKNNLNLNGKKNRMSVISLSISGILIIAMIVLTGSLNLKEMLLQIYPLNENFMIGINMDNFYERFPEVSKNNPFSDEFISEINSIVGVEKVVKTQCVIGKILEPKISYPKEKEELAVINSLCPEMISNVSEVVSGNIDYNSLQDNSIIINQYRVEHSDCDYDKIKVGDTMHFQFSIDDNLVQKDFKVVGIAYFPSTGLFYVTPEAIKTITPYNSRSHISIFCEPNSQNAVQTELENIINKNPNLTLKVYKEEYSTVNYYMKALMSGIYVICLFIVFFGILNMANMLINSAIIRKHEFALLQAVGMTTKQLRKMLYREGMSISVKSVILSTIFGIVAGKGLCYLANEVMALKFIKFHVPVLPILIFAAFLIGLQMIISSLICKNIEKDTLTERLQTD
jgi:putative ABC transport system permease protein